MTVSNTVTPSAPMTYNACNASVEVLSFLESRVTGDEWFCPSYLASKDGLNLPDGTIRSVLKKLLADNKVIMENRGKYHFYASTKRLSDDFNRLLKTHGTAKKWQIHGLTLKITAKDVGLGVFLRAYATRHHWVVLKGCRLWHLCCVSILALRISWAYVFSVECGYFDGLVWLYVGAYGL